MPFRRVHFAEAIALHPGRTLAIVVIITLLFFMINMDPGMFGLTQNTEEPEEAWFPDNELSDTVADLRNNYGSNAQYLQILVKGNLKWKNKSLKIVKLEMYCFHYLEINRL
jgi:hypothetical protein